jgi:hypothetical protein
MNWGNKLIIVFILFAIGIGFLVYKANSVKYDLVSKDYYKEELRYQDKIDGINNASKLSELNITEDSTNIIVQMPKELNGHKVEGEVFFYCPTDETKDKKLPLKVDNEGKQLIAKNEVKKTKYQVKITWKTGNVNYYSQKEFVVK